MKWSPASSTWWLWRGRTLFQYQETASRSRINQRGEKNVAYSEHEQQLVNITTSLQSESEASTLTVVFSINWRLFRELLGKPDNKEAQQSILKVTWIHFWGNLTQTCPNFMKYLTWLFSSQGSGFLNVRGSILFLTLSASNSFVQTSSKVGNKATILQLQHFQRGQSGG